jgi:hypothetical protein
MGGLEGKEQGVDQFHDGIGESIGGNLDVY